MRLLNLIILSLVALSPATAKEKQKKLPRPHKAHHHVMKHHINCLGSFFCDNHENRLSDVYHMIQKIDPERHYVNNEYITCLSMAPIDWLPGRKCLFLQETKDGINGSRVLQLIETMIDAEVCLRYFLFL